MEPKRFHIDEALYECGKEATDIIITACGECKAEIVADSVPITMTSVGAVANSRTTLTSGISISSEGSHSTHTSSTTTAAGAVKTAAMVAFLNRMKGVQVVNLGRIAPYSVLGTCIALQNDLADVVCHCSIIRFD